MATPDIEVSKNGKLLARVLEDFSCLDNNTAAYNSWISRIGDQLAARSDDIGEGRYVTFGPTMIVPPVNPNTGQGIIRPVNTREEKFTYAAEIKTHVRIRRGGSLADPCSGEIVEQTTKPLSVGRIQCMVKSALCHLDGKSKAELEAMNEDPRDPGGYFIVNGLSRTAPFNQQMRVNTYVISSDTSREPPEPVCTITADTIRGTMVASVRVVYVKVARNHIAVPKINLNLNNVRKKTSSVGKKKVYYTFNVFRAIRYFAQTNYNPDREDAAQMEYFQDPNNIMEFMLGMTKPEWRKRVRIALIPTYIDALSHSNDHDDITDLITASGGSVGDPIKGIQYTINSSVIAHEDPENFVGRIQTLCMMAVQLAEHETGYRGMTDRDSWTMKRLVTSAKRCSQLLRGYFKNFTRAALSQNSEKADVTLQSIISNASHTHVTEGFQTSFTGPRWGVRTVNVREENPVNDLQMGTFLEMVAMLARLNTTVDRKTKSFKLRGVQSSGWGFIDPNDSPESSAIGLVLELAITAVITVEMPPDGVYLVLNGDVGVIMKEGQQPTAKQYLFSKPAPDHNNIVIVNGLFKGWCNGREALLALRYAKRQGLIDRQSCVLIDHYGYVIIHTDEGRLVRPLLVIDEDGELVIEKKGMWDAPVRDLFEHGCVEYVDAHEQIYAYIAELPESLEERRKKKEHFQTVRDQAIILLENDPENVQAKKDFNNAEYELKIIRINPFTHMEIHPQAIYAPSLTTMPFLEFNQAPRVSFQSHMAKQAMGTYSTAYERRFEDSKVLVRPTKPLVTQQLESFLGLDLYPHTTNLNFAFLAIRGTTQEDAVVMNEDTVASGLLNLATFTSVETMVENGEILGRPTKFREGEDPERYQFLTNQGLPMINSPLNQGDFVIGKILITKEGEKNQSIALKVGESGIVHRVFVTKFKNQTRVVVVIRRDREHQIGDKASSRYAQKGTTSEIVPKRFLPFFEEDGTVPDVFVNPHSVPKRMTVGYVREAVFGMLAALTGKRYNATVYEKHDIEEVYRQLEEYGFGSKGYRWMVDPISGLRFKAMVFSGPIAMQLLCHLGPEKLQVRASGAVKLLTRQPPRGGCIGGRRVGEMERDAILSHGASNFLLERLITMSDAYQTTFCSTCGNFANIIVTGDAFREECQVCERSAKIKKKTIPYVFKLVVQYMMGALIHIRFNPDRLRKAIEVEVDEDEPISDEDSDDESKKKDSDDESDEESEEEFSYGGDSDDEESD